MSGDADWAASKTGPLYFQSVVSPTALVKVSGNRPKSSARWPGKISISRAIASATRGFFPELLSSDSVTMPTHPPINSLTE